MGLVNLPFRKLKQSENRRGDSKPCVVVQIGFSHPQDSQKNPDAQQDELNAGENDPPRDYRP